MVLILERRERGKGSTSARKLTAENRDGRDPERLSALSSGSQFLRR
jgi:hypothetical protein